MTFDLKGKRMRHQEHLRLVGPYQPVFSGQQMQNAGQLHSWNLPASTIGVGSDNFCRLQAGPRFDHGKHVILGIFGDSLLLGGRFQGFCFAGRHNVIVQHNEHQSLKRFN